MNFSLSPELLSLQEKVREFIKTEIIPMENDPRQDAHGPHESLKHELIEKAKKIGLLTPHGPKEYGCLALSHVEKAIVFSLWNFPKIIWAKEKLIKIKSPPLKPIIIRELWLPWA